MKQLKLMLLMAFFSFAFTSISFGQTVGGGGTGTSPVNTTAVTRDICSLQGCYGGQVILALTSTLGSSTNTFHAGMGETYMYNKYGKNVSVTINSVTSTGTYTLPTVIGQPLVMTGSECGLPAYNIYITKTADKQYTLGVFYSNQ